tara:strand:+ start:250 stop:528 length:279 start_codon:yes stop_codon:yes gene_type:complete
MKIQTMWLFKCDHSAYQLRDENGRLVDQINDADDHVQPDLLETPCPSCFEAEHKATEAKRKSEEKEKNSLAAYKDQAEFMKKQIEVARANDD